MKVLMYDSHKFERDAFDLVNKNFDHQINYVSARLDETTASLAKGYNVVCSFVNDRLDNATLTQLQSMGVQLIALRSAGFNHLDVEATNRLRLSAVRVPEYSPHAIAEHAVALLLTLNRKVHKAHARIRDLNFSLDGLVGFDIYQKTVGVIGTGRIGEAFVRIMNGFGAQVIAYDTAPNPELKKAGLVKYVSLNELLQSSDIISLHTPLTSETKHIISTDAFNLMKPNVILINTGRGALIDTKALIQALKKSKIAGAALDVYEEEGGIFFSDHSTDGVNDDLLARLLTFPQVILTSHQAFLTHEALSNIAECTLKSITALENGNTLDCWVAGPKQKEVNHAGA